jgi:hypothetical protein
MKIRMISIIFVGVELLNLTLTGLTEAENVHFVLCRYVILAKVLFLSEIHELSISVFSC